MNRLLLLLLSLALWCCPASGDLEVLSPPDLQKSYQVVSRLDVFPTTFDITAHLVLADPSHCCSQLANVDLNGTIVFCIDTSRCGIQEKARNVAKEVGVQGMVLLMADGSVGSNYHFGEDRDDSIHLPSIEMGNKNGQDLYNALQDGETVYVRLTTPDTNPWLDIAWGPAGVIFQILGELASIGCFCFAIWKWRSFIIAEGFAFTAPQLCLALQALAGLVRMLYFIQPLRFSKFFYPDGLSSFMETITYPMTFTATFVITFYWQSALSRFKNSKKGKSASLPDLGRYKIPFIVVIIFLWTIELVSNIMRSTAESIFDSLIVITAFINLLISLFGFVFFSITGVRILRALKQSSARVDKGRGRTLKLVTMFLVMSAIGLFGFCLDCILFVSPVNTSGPSESFMVWVILWVCLFLTSAPQIAAFQAPGQKESSSSNGTDPKLKTTGS